MRSVRLLRNDVFRAFKPLWNPYKSQKYAKAEVVELKNEEASKDPYEGNLSFTECDQYTKVTLIGAAGRVGRTLSLLLKTCPLVDHLCLFDIDKSVKGIGVDISHIDTKCCVSYVSGMKNIHKALDAPDVVVIAAGYPASPQLSEKNLFDKNAPIVAGLSEACARFCPKACVVLITSPINSLVPVMGEVYQMIINKIPSRKLFGLTTLDVVRANTFVAEVVRKDPNNVIVPVVGGTSQETIVPVISQMKPCCKIKRGEMMALTECLKRAESNLADCQNCGTPGASSLSTAYAAFRFTSSLVMALKGAQDIIECAYVKSDIIPELEYLASPLKLGMCGIEHNFGYPSLSEDELAGMERSAAVLTSDIKMGKDFARGIEETVVKGLVWKVLRDRIDEDSGKFSRRNSKRNSKKSKAKVEEVKDLVPVTCTALVQVRKYGKAEENVRGWFSRARAPLRKFLYGKSVLDSKENGEELTQGMIDSVSCREDFDITENIERYDGRPKASNASAPKETPLNGTYLRDLVASTSKFAVCGKLLSNGNAGIQPCRLYHTGNKNSFKYHDYIQSKTTEKYKRYLMEDRNKTPKPMKAVNVLKYKTKSIQKSSKRPPWETKVERTHYKLLNASAKQKFRSFNVQKKFVPSAPVLLMIDRDRKERLEKNCDLAVGQEDEKTEDVEGENESKGNEEEESEGAVGCLQTEEETNKDLIVPKREKDETERYKDFIMKQLQDLRRENQDLKRKLMQIMENKKLEDALQEQTDNIELEKTKLKACWLVMSSTMDAFSNFCKKFTTKSDPSLPAVKNKSEDDDEEFVDAVESQEPDKKAETYDEKYYNFLKKLMEDQVEVQKSRNRIQVGK